MKGRKGQVKRREGKGGKRKGRKWRAGEGYVSTRKETSGQSNLT